jgi:hypothetical protein
MPISPCVIQLGEKNIRCDEMERGRAVNHKSVYVRRVLERKSLFYLNLFMLFWYDKLFILLFISIYLFFKQILIFKSEIVREERDR